MSNVVKKKKKLLAQGNNFIDQKLKMRQTDSQVASLTTSECYWEEVVEFISHAEVEFLSVRPSESEPTVAIESFESPSESPRICRNASAPLCE